MKRAFSDQAVYNIITDNIEPYLADDLLEQLEDSFYYILANQIWSGYARLLFIALR